MLVHAITTNATYEFAADVRAGLARPGQKELPSKYLYDDVGSALVEVISHLSEYGLTRAGRRFRTRQGQWQEDALDPGGSEPVAADFLLSRGNIPHISAHVPTRT